MLCLFLSFIISIILFYSLYIYKCISIISIYYFISIFSYFLFFFNLTVFVYLILNVFEYSSQPYALLGSR